MLEVVRKRFTVQEFGQMVAAGVLTEDQRLELIQGEIVEMNPIGVRHANCVAKLTELLAPLALDRAALLWVQNPVRLGHETEVYPDVVLLRRRPNGYREAHATGEDALLVVEVSDTTLGYDRSVKLRLYARAGVQEVWIVDVGGEQVFLYQEPTVEGYQLTRVRRRGDTVAPLAFAEHAIAVEDILA